MQYVHIIKGKNVTSYIFALTLQGDGWIGMIFQQHPGCFLRQVHGEGGNKKTYIQGIQAKGFLPGSFNMLIISNKRPIN